MKRILFVYHVSEVGGGSYCLLNLLKAIDKKVFEPLILLPNKGPLCDEIENMGMHVVYFPELILYPYNKSLLRIDTIRFIHKIRQCKSNFAEILQQIRPEIVYFNTMMLFPYLQEAKEQGCKTVLHVREHWPLDEHKKQLERARRIVYTYADQLIAINRYSASIFPKKDALIVYDWIDMESRRGGPSLHDILNEDSAGKRVYLFTGGLQVIKGTIEVLKTFTTYIKGDNRRLLVLGVDPKMNWNGLRGEIKRILSYLGYKTYKERVVNLCRQDNRIVCVPATYLITGLMEQVDGYISFFTIPHANLALAESIIVGLPGIAGRSDESLEYSDEGELAILYDFASLASFKEAWLQLDKGEDNLREIIKQHSGAVAEKFSPARNAKMFNDALRAL